MKKSVTAILVFMGIMLGSCSSGKVVSVGCVQFQKELGAAGVLLLDVRTPDEFAQGHLQGAENIDVLADGFADRAVTLLRSRGVSEVCVYCRSGRRSLDAAAQLVKAGFKVTNLDEGILGWQKQGLPVTTR